MKVKIILYLIVYFVLITNTASSKEESVSEVNLDSIRESRFKNPQKALNAAFEVLKAYTEKGNTKKIAETQKNIAVLLDYVGLHSRALKYYYLAYDYSLKQDKNIIQGWNLVHIGNIHFNNGMYEIAEGFYEIAAQEFEELGWLTAKATAVNNLGLVAIEKKNYDRAMAYFLTGLDLRKKDGTSTFNVVHSYNYIGDLCITMGDTTNAMKYFQYIIDAGEISGEGNINGIVHRYCGKIYTLKGETEKAFVEYKLAVSDFTDEFNAKLLVETYLEIAAAMHNNKTLVKEFLEKADSIGSKYGLFKLRIQALKNLSDFHSENLNDKLALHFHNVHDSIYFQYFEGELKDAFENAESVLELSKTQVKLAESSIKLKENRIIRNILIILGVLTLIFSFYIYYTLNRKRKSDQVIQQQKASILKQQLNMLELSHRKTERELDSKNRELSNAAIRVVEMQIQQRETNDRIKEIIHKSIDKNHPIFEGILNFLNNNHLKHSLLKDFENQLTDSNKDIYRKLLVDFPDLTPTELKICAMLRLNLSSKEIAVLLNRSIRTIDFTRNSIRKKLKLEMQDNLNTFLLSV